eukprot:TRINITY_DN34240_c0_g1_i2.p1 TRINITY_DN34240_c0_g1~~TRINITY_DN34240_c0_g1_i2.p1  ORF type:complete len:408 (-),score=33.09 TRINITY_DN34240_c0_g1_i2:44-1267(-)
MALFDPLKELNLSRPDQAKEVTCVHFSGKGIAAIHPHFQHFVNVDELWLSNNKLKRIDNLFPLDYGNNDCDIADRCHGKGCPRLRSLYLSNNRITTLSGDLRHLRFVEILLLANNKLSNMEIVSKFLRHLQFLKQLDLFGNPLAEEQNYREYFIQHHPSVQILDRAYVTDEERKKAKMLFGTTTTIDVAPHVSFGRTLSEKDRVLPDKVDLLSTSVKRLESQATAIKARNAKKIRDEQQQEVQRLKKQMEDRKNQKPPPPPGMYEPIVAKVLEQRKAAVAEQVQKEFHEKLMALLISQHERDIIQQLYENDRCIGLDDCQAIVDMLGVSDDNDTHESDLQRLIPEGELTPPAFLDLLANWRPLCEKKLEELYAAAQEAVLKGRRSEGRQLHQSINFLNEHIQTLSAA